MASDNSLVSVVVPAWNAEATLRETLESAASQTHRAIEILIIDDGSSDTTATVAAQFCAVEPRARLIRQRNRGVAAARNRGIAEAKGQFIAPLDADDLWHPEKIQRQLATFRESSARTGLVYCWYRMIDERGLVCERSWAPIMEGHVFDRHLDLNFGTGSSPLIRRSALGDLRYDPALQRAGNEGCEDWLLQLQIALRFEVACSRAFLLGYRKRAGSMASDHLRMIRSQIQMYEILLRQVPPEKARMVRGALERLQEPKRRRPQIRAMLGRIRAILPPQRLDYHPLGVPFFESLTIWQSERAAG